MQANIRALLEDRLKITPPNAVAALVAVLALSATGLQILRGLGSTPQTEVTPPHPAVVSIQAPDPLPVILSANVFGAESATPSASSAGAPVTQEASGFVLRAAFASERGTGGAIIENSSGQADWFEVGQSVVPGLVLKEVHPDHVIFDRGGSPERLQFERLSELGVAQAAAAASAGGSGGSPSFAMEPGQPQPIPQDLAPDEKANLIRQRLEELRNRARK